MLNEICIAIVGFNMVVFAHVMHCISRTAEQRRALMIIASKSEPYLALKQFDDLHGKFDQHFRRLVTFRSPWMIYPISLHPIIKELGA